MKDYPQYPFGFGLSFTSFTYSDIKLSAASIKKNQPVEVQATVTNSGKLGGDEVVQLYITDDKASTDVPQFTLNGIKRIRLAPGQSETVKFSISPDMLMMVNDKGEKVLEPGTFTISVGGSLPTQRSVTLGASPVQKTTLTVK